MPKISSPKLPALVVREKVGYMLIEASLKRDAKYSCVSVIVDDQEKSVRFVFLKKNFDRGYRSKLKSIFKRVFNPRAFAKLEELSDTDLVVNLVRDNAEIRPVAYKFTNGQLRLHFELQTESTVDICPICIRYRITVAF